MWAVAIRQGQDFALQTTERSDRLTEGVTRSYELLPLFRGKTLLPRSLGCCLYVTREGV